MFGKTALFYAAQYGTLETVQMLVDAGADVNHPLKNLKDFEDIYEDHVTYGDLFILDVVAGFTPLIYSMRYGSKETTEYLKSKGATDGCVDAERMQKWIQDE